MINQYILHIKSSIQLGNHAGSDNALLEPKHQNTHTSGQPAKKRNTRLL